MPDLEATSDELLAVVRELWPREYDIAALHLIVRKQQDRIAELERGKGGSSRDES